MKLNDLYKIAQKTFASPFLYPHGDADAIALVSHFVIMMHKSQLKCASWKVIAV